MLPDRVSNPGPLTYESGVLPIALHGPVCKVEQKNIAQYKVMRKTLSELRDFRFDDSANIIIFLCSSVLKKKERKKIK